MIRSLCLITLLICSGSCVYTTENVDVRDVRVEPGWVAISNGQLRSSRAEQKRGRFRFRMNEPIPSYLFSLVSGEFACIEDQQD